MTITKVGRARLAKALPGHVEVLRGMLFQPLSGADVSALAAPLEPVLDHMRASPPRRPPPAVAGNPPPDL